MRIAVVGAGAIGAYWGAALHRGGAEVHLIARPQLDYDEIARYLADVGGSSWLERLDRGELDEVLNDPQNLAEFAGRLCYRSWEPGLNPNVTRVRTDQTAYLTNILASMHGSVLEHVSFSFVLHNVSRVATHELVRHRPGVAISQESLRFVRLKGDYDYHSGIAMRCTHSSNQSKHTLQPNPLGCRAH